MSLQGDPRVAKAPQDDIFSHCQPLRLYVIARPFRAVAIPYRNLSGIGITGGSFQNIEK